MELEPDWYKLIQDPDLRARRWVWIEFPMENLSKFRYTYHVQLVAIDLAKANLKWH